MTGENPISIKGKKIRKTFQSDFPLLDINNEGNRRFLEKSSNTTTIQKKIYKCVNKENEDWNSGKCGTQ